MYDKLNIAYAQSAKLVQLYGETYLPIFKRLHDEIERLKAKRSLQEKALQIAAGMQL